MPRKKRWLWKSIGAVIGLLLGWQAASWVHPANAISDDPPPTQKP